MDDMKPKRRWMPVVLVASLALNFAVLAAIGGAAWRHHGEGRAGPRDYGSERGGGFVRALPPQAREAVREELRSQPRLRMDNEALLAALRQTPFDAASAGHVLETLRDHSLARNEIARAAWLVQVEAMSAQERAEYADRLEKFASKRKGKWKKNQE